MRVNMTRLGPQLWFKAVLPVAATVLLLIATAAGKSDKNKQPASDPPVDPTQYVGSETCKTCHEDIFKNFEKTPHWKTTLGHKGERGQGCEACHGPGKAHVEGGGDKTKIFVFAGAEPEKVSKRCMSCHEYG